MDTPLTPSSKSAKMTFWKSHVLFATESLLVSIQGSTRQTKWQVTNPIIYIWDLYSDLQVKGNWHAYMVFNELMQNTFKVFFFLIVQVSGEKAQKEREQGETQHKQWDLTCLFVGNRCKRSVFQSRINWPKKCTRHTHKHRGLCVRLLVESALQSRILWAFPWRNRLIIITCQGGNRKYS